MKKDITIKDLRDFGSVVGFVFVLLGYLLPLIKHKPPVVWVIILGALLFFAGVLLPRHLKPLYKIWMKFAQILGAINGRIILTIFYCVILMPISIIVRIFKKDMIGLKIRRDASSYWIKRQPQTDPKKFEYPF